MNNAYKIKKFDIVTKDNSIIHGVIYTEKPSFNYSEILKNKNKVEEIKKLKSLRNKICDELRINKIDLVIDENKYRFITSRGIVSRYYFYFKELNLFPAIAEETKEDFPIEIEIEFL